MKFFRLVDEFSKILPVSRSRRCHYFGIVYIYIKCGSQNILRWTDFIVFKINIFLKKSYFFLISRVKNSIQDGPSLSYNLVGTLLYIYRHDRDSVRRQITKNAHKFFLIIFKSDNN